ncbi:MAG: MarR family winged helix-turn-helix transcriptional regulator [Gaiellaceae bacterium]
MSAHKDDSSVIDRQADELAGYWLQLGHRIMSRKLASSLYPELKDRLPRGQVHALVLLAEAGEPKINQLAALLSLDESTVTRLVDKLEAAGLAERRRSTSDRRSTGVVITAEGLEIVTCAREHQRVLLAEVLSALDPAERTEFIRLTAKAAEAMRLQTGQVTSG